MEYIAMIREIGAPLAANMQKISIALCTYNGGRFLREQLESFLLQTRRPNELIVGDDRSTDNTISIIDEFAASAEFPVHVEVNDRNLGSTKNFEKTIQRCSGDLIFLADQDDVWLPEKIEKAAAEFSKSENVGLVFTNAELVDEKLQPLSERLWDYTFPARRRATADRRNFYKTLLDGNVVTGATAAFRGSFVKDIVPFPSRVESFIHDAWIALSISVNADIVFLDEALMLYRQHAGQQLGVNWEESSGSMRERFTRAVKILRDREKLLRQLTDLLNEYPSLSNSSRIKDAIPMSLVNIENNILHLENRLKVYDSTNGRAHAILAELRSGRYSKYSKGFISAVKDFLKS